MNTSIKKYVKAVINIVIAVLLLLFIIWAVPKLLVFFAPFIVGWIIALIASPVVRFLENKLKIRRKASSAVVVILVIGVVILGGYLIGGKLLLECQGLIEELPQIWESWQKDLAEIGENLNGIYTRLPKDVQNALDSIGEKAGKLVVDFVSSAGTPTITAVGNFAKQLPAIIVAIVMCLLSAYFFVADRETLGIWWKKFMPESIQKGFRILQNSLIKAVGGYLKAQLKIEVWMFLILVIGLAVLGVDYVLPIALGIACLDLLPIFGTGTVMVPWAIIKFLSGDYKMTIGLLIIWGGGQLIRQIIQPKIMGDSIGVPPIPTLFLLYIGYKMGSVWGLILAVPIGMIFYTLYTEGMFDTTKHSIQILVTGVNRFRKLTPQDMKILKKNTIESDSESIKQEIMTDGIKEEKKDESDGI